MKLDNKKRLTVLKHITDIRSRILHMQIYCRLMSYECVSILHIEANTILKIRMNWSSVCLSVSLIVL